MTLHRSVACLALFVMAACENETAPSGDGSEVQVAPAPQAAPLAAEPKLLSPVRPLKPGESQLREVNGQRVLEAARQTADGEVIRTHQPDLAPTLEVQEGARCGALNEAGALLSCQAGTYCSSPAEGAQATCVRAPAARRWDG